MRGVCGRRLIILSLALLLIFSCSSAFNHSTSSLLPSFFLPFFLFLIAHVNHSTCPLNPLVFFSNRGLSESIDFYILDLRFAAFPSCLQQPKGCQAEFPCVQSGKHKCCYLDNQKQIFLVFPKIK